MSTKFEQLLDYLVNEEHEKANELFHEIVVEKSRDIYENLIAEEEKEEEMDEAADEEMDEAADEEEMDESKEEDDEEMDESMDLEDSYQMDGQEQDNGFGSGEEGDATDELGAEIGAGDEEGEKSEDDAIFDIKNAIQELEAAFAELEKAQGAETGHDEFGGDEMGEPEDEPEDEMMGLREYRETVKDGHGAERKGRAEGEIAGANTGEKMPTGTNTKSAVNANADRTKPTSGANAKNLNQGATGEGANTGTSPNAKAGGGLLGGVKGEFTKGVEKNISSSSKSSMKSGSDLGKQGAGYPGNNKSAGPVGSGTGDKAGQTSVRNDSSLIKHIK